MIRPANSLPRPANDYPTRDGRPFDSDWHRDLMNALIETLDTRYAADPMVYVSGNLLTFYEKGNKRRHVAPDVFVVFGVPKGDRGNYLVWEEGKGPDVVIELTSKMTRFEDARKKRVLYEGTLKVKEYFIFDLKEEYLTPSFQGFRRVRGKFRPIDPIDGRMTSELLQLHLERDGTQLRLWQTVGQRLLTPNERADAEAARADRAEAENERLRREVEELRRRIKNGK